MKTRSKVLLTLVCAVMLVAGSVFGTYAYLTSQDTVTNTFTVGNVKIILDEAKVDEMGKIVAGADRVKENTYRLLPGLSYTKDPTVHVQKGSENCYVRMLVTVNNINAVKAAFPESKYPTYYNGGVFLLQNLVDWNSDWWMSTGAVTNDGSAAVYEFRHKGPVLRNTGADITLAPLFTTITIPGTVNNAELAALQDIKISVVAHAIQADGFADANAAWEAFN